MQWYDNIFDVMDDNEDILECTPEELNRYYMSGQIRSNFEEEDDNNYSNINEEVTLDIDTILFADHTDDNQSATITNAEKKIENKATQKQEDILSKKLSQLSTDSNDEQPIAKSDRKRRRSTSRSLNLVSKKIKFTQNNDTKDKSTNDKIIEEKSDDVPAYLSLTNVSFLRVLQQIQNTENSIDVKDLQIIALLMHRITTNRIQKQINTVYLRSGTGKLDDSSFDLIEIDRRVWPKEVRSGILGKSAQSNITTATEINSDSEQLDYENLANERLQQIHEQFEQYTQQLIDKKNHLIGFTSPIEKTIVQYVQHYGIIPLQMKRDLKIALLKHDYNTIILRRKYEQENPNEYHIEIAEQLCTLKYELEKSKRELIELKQRVFYQKLPAFVKDIELSPSPSTISAATTTTSNMVHNQIFNNMHERMIQQKKLDLLAAYIAKAEIKYYQADSNFNSEYTKMLNNHRNLVRNKGMTSALSDLLEKRLTNITDRLRDIHCYRINYFLRSSYSDLENIYKQIEPQENTNINVFFSNVISDTIHGLNQKQIQLLSRGPAYVPPCQSRLKFSSKSTKTTITDIVKKQYAPLKHQMASLFSKHRVNIASSWDVHSIICQKFTNLFAISIPHNIQQRATEEMKLIQSIRSSLKTNNMILRRTADNRNTFYVGKKNDFEAKANEFMLKSSDKYEFTVAIGDDEDNNDDKKKQPQNPHYFLKGRIEAINFALETLGKRKALDNDTINKLIIDPKKVKLTYLYFRADISKENELTLVPTISLRKQQPSVNFKISIGSNVHYFNAYIENRKGELYTKVYHDPMIPRYTLPYVVGHSKVRHSDWLRSTLLRAVCYCSSVGDFLQERLYLELTYLVNGYSFFFVESHIQNFFDYFQRESMRYCSEQTNYHSFRRQWFDFFELQNQRSEKLQQLDDNKQVIRFSYFYDYGPRCEFNQYFHELWSDYFRSNTTLSNEKNTMLQLNSSLSSNERKRILNIQLSILPAFTPLNDWRVHCVSQTTDPSLLHYLIELARKTVKYTIDTEHDYYTYEPALIQIEFICRQSIILLIETCHLPQASTVTFWLIKSLLKIIFNPSNIIYSWGDAVNELSRFIHYNLFSWSILYQMNNNDIQSGFKIWYNKTFIHDCSLDLYGDDHELCTCSHRPVKHKNNQWSLQKAIAYAFHEFLDKSRCKSKWRQRLSSRNQIRQKMCNELIRYAANDCLAVTKLQMLVGFNYTKEQLDIYGINHSDTQGTTFRKDAALTQEEEEEEGKETTKELKPKSQSNQFATSRTESNEDK
ncbi:hypothetical protein I4U23_027323 [Adineta vaga]|nr:hypothetical protein I4U23_027323 [Adineta vaga]